MGLYRRKLNVYGTDVSTWTTDKTQMTYIEDIEQVILSTDKTKAEVSELLAGLNLFTGVGINPQAWQILQSIFPEIRLINHYYMVAPTCVYSSQNRNPVKRQSYFNSQKITNTQWSGYDYIYWFPSNWESGGAGVYRLSRTASAQGAYLYPSRMDGRGVRAASSSWTDVAEFMANYESGNASWEWGDNWNVGADNFAIPVQYADEYGIIWFGSSNASTQSAGITPISVQTNSDLAKAFIAAWFDGATEGSVDPANPTGDDEWYAQSDPSEVADLDFDERCDDIDTPSIPSISAVAAGLVSLFNPTLGQIQALSSFLWSADFIDNVKKIFSSPADAIVGLSIYPCTPAAGTPTTIKVGAVSTTISMAPVTSQMMAVNMGTITVDHAYAGALSREPYTKCRIYLPYIGIKDISIDDIMDRQINLTYNIDFLTGSCLAILKVWNDDGHYFPLYEWGGNCATQVPLSSRDFNGLITAGISLAGSAAVTVASSGLGAALTASSVVGAASALVSNAKPRVSHYSGIGGSCGLMGEQKPYLIFEWPRQALAKDYFRYDGYPLCSEQSLGNLTGYTMVESIHLQGFSCTITEQDEIEKLLKEGVIL